MQLPPAAKKACADATLQLSTRTQHIMRSAVRFSNDWPSFKHYIPCLFGSSGDRPRRACGTSMPSGVPATALQRETQVRRESPRRTRRLRWDQTRTCQVVMTGQVKSDQVRSGQVSNSSQGNSGQLLPIALLDIVIGIGIRIGLRQRVYSTTDGKRRRGHFDTCAF